MDSKRFRPDLITTRSTCISRTASDTITVLKPRIFCKSVGVHYKHNIAVLYTQELMFGSWNGRGGVAGSLGIVRDFHKSDGEGVEFSALIMLSATSISQPKDTRNP